MFTFLDLLVVVAMVLLVLMVVSVGLMFLLKNKKAKKVFFYIALGLALYLSTIGLRMGFTEQVIASLFVILLVIGSVVLDILGRKNEKFISIARITSAASIILGFISAFLI